MKKSPLLSPEISLEQAWDLVLNAVMSALTVDRNHPFRFASLATVDLHGTPHLRTVVLREFQKPGKFVIFTDKRSEKVKHIHQNHQIGLLFYDDHSGLQLRVNGMATVVESGGDHARYWSERGSKNPFSYTSVKPPGTPIQHPEEAYDWYDEDASNFCFIRVDASLIEFLQLDGVNHLRAEMVLNAEGGRVNTQIMRWIAP